MNAVKPQALMSESEMSTQALKQKIACRFGDAAPLYDNHALIQKEIAEVALNVIAQQWPADQKAAMALDIGCGTGAFSSGLLRFAENVTGVDLAQGMIEYARLQHNRTGMNWAVCDAEALPVANNSIQLIYSSMALQWLASPDLVARECFNALSENGQGTIAVVVEGSLHELDDCWHSINQPSPVNRFLAGNDWQQAFNNVGFEVALQQRCFTSWHDNIFAVLHSIKDIGAGVVLQQGNENSLNKRKLMTLNSTYKDKFAKGDKLPLSWQIGFLSFNKPQWGKKN